MIVVVKKLDSSILMVSDVPTPGFDPLLCTFYSGWDWSKANLTGVDRSQINWIKQLIWDGTTIVKKS